MKILLKILILLAIAGLFVSCSTLGAGYYEDSGLIVANQLNKGMHESLTEDSVYPFVFEQEILASGSQVKMLWEGLVKAGYYVENPSVAMNQPVSDKDSLLFAESWEVKSYFEKYVSEEDRLILIEGDNTSFYLILRRNNKESYSIIGWKEVAK